MYCKTKNHSLLSTVNFHFRSVLPSATEFVGKLNGYIISAILYVLMLQ